MSDPGGPPAHGWYALGGHPDDLAYFDGQAWTWRRWRDERGEWHQEPISPPRATPPGRGTGRGLHPGTPGYPVAPPYGAPRAGPWGGPEPSRGRPGMLGLHLVQPERQARWKTLLRALLVVPSAVVLELLGIAVFFLTIGMWFAALFTARVPGSWWRFSVAVLRWQARTLSFALFLTDRYPPFTLEDVAYPVRLSLEGPPDRFNRLAVFFRAILVVPAAIVLSAFSYGVEIISIVTWLVTLVAGKCPRALHLMTAAWLRYSLRVTAYQLLLTTSYPSGALGDEPPAYRPASLERGDIVLRGAAKALAVVAIVIGALAYLSSWVLPAAVSGTSARRGTPVAELHATGASGHRGISAAGGSGASRRSSAEGTLWGSLRLTTGSVRLRPTHAVTVEVVSAKRAIVARRRVGPSGSFHVRVAAGRYRLDVLGVKDCVGKATVRAGRRAVAAVDCTLADALGSAAFETLPVTGAVTTRADAMKRLARGTAGSTRIDATEVTWADWIHVSTTGKGGPAAPPTHLSPATAVWVACESGGTYTSFDGESGYSSTCTAYSAKTGQPLGSTDSHGWPSWFTRLTVRHAGG